MRIWPWRRRKPEKTYDGGAHALSYRPGFSCQVRGIDAIYEAAFGPCTAQGCFVEVGAFDGDWVSNTAFLADAGWRGLYIEPVTEFAALCAARHAANKNVTVVNKAAGAAPGSNEIFIAGPLSTAEARQHEAYGQIDWAAKHLTAKKQRIEIVTLDSILTEQAIAPGFELLVIDVEGMEPQVFAGFDLRRWRPRMLIVELHDNHPDFNRHGHVASEHGALRRDLVAAGYREVYIDQLNTIFRLMA